MVNEKVELVRLLGMDQDTCGFCKDTLEKSEFDSLTFTDIGVKGAPIQDVVRYCDAARSVGMTDGAAKAFLFRTANVARMELLCDTHRIACQVYLPSKVNEDGGLNHSCYMSYEETASDTDTSVSSVGIKRKMEFVGIPDIAILAYNNPTYPLHH